MGLAEQLNNILQNLRSDISDVEGSLIASTDGMLMAHQVSHSDDPNALAAMVAASLGLGKRLSETFKGGPLMETSVRGNEGYIFVFSAGEHGVLAVTTKARTNVGLVNLECRNAAKKIAQLL